MRGKVLSFTIGAHPEVTATARDLFAQALGSTERRRVPRLFITTGVIGSGKTTVARHVAAGAGAVLVRTDVERKRLAGLGLTDRTPAGFGEALYSPASHVLRRLGGGFP